MVVIREEMETDAQAIRRLNEEAFGQPAEANIVDRLRSSCDRVLSLVAVLDKRIATITPASGSSGPRTTACGASGRECPTRRS